MTIFFVHHRSDLSPGRSVLVNNPHDVIGQHSHHRILYLRLASAPFSAVLEREYKKEVADVAAASSSPSYHYQLGRLQCGQGLRTARRHSAAPWAVISRRQ